MYPYKYKISVRLRHPSLNLTKISQEICELLPDVLLKQVCNAGDERITPKGNKIPGICTQSHFAFAFSEDTTNTDENSLEAAILETLTKLEPCNKLLREFVTAAGSIEFFIGVFIDRNSGIVLDPKLVQRVAESNVEIQLDIYPPDHKTAYRPTFKVNDLEKAVMEMILEEEIPEKEMLKEQWRQAKIRERRLTGVGFFLDFDIPDNVPRTTTRSDFNSDRGDTTVVAHTPELKNGVGFSLFVRDGKLSSLEGYTYEDWPNTSEFKLERVKLPRVDRR